jgi:MFS family permease
MTNNRLFFACIISLVATAFGFIVRAFLINEWGILFNLTETQKGAIQGAGLFPFALSIILFSLVIDRVGYGRIMAVAWSLHIVSAMLTITANTYTMLYIGTFLFALANGAVEAVINPATTTMYPKNKTHSLNILHAGWPGGLVLGGILAILLSGFTGPDVWRYKIGLLLIPTVIYGLLMRGQKWPVQERVAHNVSYLGMLKEFGWGSCLIVTFFGAKALDEIAQNIFNVALPAGVIILLVLVPTLFFVSRVRSFGRPIFIFLLLIMLFLATTELGTDSWIASLMTPVLKAFGENAGNWVLVYTSFIMFVLRFFAGPLVHRLNPLGLLACCSVVAMVGLLWLSNAGTTALAVFLAATLYGVGKSYFWPTTLGVVAEQFPRGGALTINAIAGVGMIAVGVLGSPFLGVLQDKSLDVHLRQANPGLHAELAQPPQEKYLMTYRPLDKQKIEALAPEEKATVESIVSKTNQGTLAKVAILPAVMFFCYIGLIFYFRSRGGYRPVEL